LEPAGFGAFGFSIVGRRPLRRFRRLRLRRRPSSTASTNDASTLDVRTVPVMLPTASRTARWTSFATCGMRSP
jgi:hypothetical protein